MLCVDFMRKAAEVVVVQADNGLWYLEPLWRTMLGDEGLDVSDVSNVKLGWNGVYDILQLEVQKRNTVDSIKPYVLNWLYDLITTQVDPAMLQEETDFIKQVTEFMKTNHKA